MFLSHLNKDKIRRKLTLIFELKIKILKTLLVYNNKVFKPYKNIFFLSKNCFFTRVNNLCLITGRQSGVYKFLKLSRIAIRDSFYDIYGLRKSS